MLSKEIDMIKHITRLRKTRILVKQKLINPNDWLRMYSSKKICIDIGSDCFGNLSSSSNEAFPGSPRGSIGFMKSPPVVQ